MSLKTLSVLMLVVVQSSLVMGGFRCTLGEWACSASCVTSSGEQALPKRRKRDDVATEHGSDMLQPSSTPTHVFLTLS